MSSALGAGFAMGHGPVDQGGVVRSSAVVRDDFAAGITPPPFDAPFSMAQHFAALTVAHAAAASKGTSLVPANPGARIGANGGTSFPMLPSQITPTPLLNAPINNEYAMVAAGQGPVPVTSQQADGVFDDSMEESLQEKAGRGGRDGAVPGSDSKGKGDSLKQMQKRLLLLRHSSRCEAKRDDCTFSRNCRTARILWRHMSSCSNDQCQTAHCASSRYVLSHYHRCRDPKCILCAPVREYVAKSRERGPCEHKGAAVTDVAMAPVDAA